MAVGERNYSEPGTGTLFLAPSAARTRLCLIVAGIDETGLLRAVWTIPFRTGLQVPDFVIVGPPYGDPSTGWTGDRHREGGILAAGFWNNTWGFDHAMGYLK